MCRNTSAPFCFSPCVFQHPLTCDPVAHTRLELDFQTYSQPSVNLLNKDLQLSPSASEILNTIIHMNVFGNIEKKLHIAGSHLDDGAEPAGVSHIADADRPVVLSDPVCWAAHLCLDLASLPLHPRCVLLSADLQAPGAQCSLGFKAVASHVRF